ncbi:MAG: PD40 domain-containing protein [Planctomycetes bacterium]|nr:PD40 domain-containing protein [Planctomycetota bacterium]
MRLLTLLVLSVPVMPLTAAQLVSVGTPVVFPEADCVLHGVSDDARYVLFESDSRKLTPSLIFPPEYGVYLRDTLSLTTRLVAPLYRDDALPGGQSALSGNGRFVSFVSNPYPISDDYQVSIADTVAGGGAWVSTDSFGTLGDAASMNPSVNGDGRYVAFESLADNLTSDVGADILVSDIFLKDRSTGATDCMSLTPTGVTDTGDSTLPMISRNGRRVAFFSTSKQLVPGTPSDFIAGIFVHDRIAGTTVRADVSTGGTPGNRPPRGINRPAVSADGRFVAFASFADNLVAGDTNSTTDVFVRDLTLGTTVRASLANDGSQANGLSFNPTISSDGRYLCFRSEATNLVAGDTNGKLDVFVRDLVKGTTIRVHYGLFGVQANGDAVISAQICGDGFAVAYTSDATNLIGSYDHRGVYLAANDPRVSSPPGAMAARLYIQILIHYVRDQLVRVRLPRANG